MIKPNHHIGFNPIDSCLFLSVLFFIWKASPNFAPMILLTLSNLLVLETVRIYFQQELD